LPTPLTCLRCPRRTTAAARGRRPKKGGKRQTTTGVERVAAGRVSPYAIDNCGDVECAKYRQHVLVGEPA
jgi:hypothetical protein